MDLIETSQVDPEKHWYFIHKRRFLLRTINAYVRKSKSVIDVGAGSGFFSHALSKYLDLDSIICVDTNYEDSVLQNTGKIKYKRILENGDTADLYLFMDVIEHVPNDRELVRIYLDNALENSILIFTAPAFMSLWSGHDVALHHYRRYTKKEMLSLANDLDLEVLSCRYYFTPLFPIVKLLRMLNNPAKAQNDLKHQNAILNKLVLWFLKIDFIDFTKIMPGSTILLVAKKR